MTIRKGAEWGTVGPPPAGALEARSDAELRAIVETCRLAGRDIPPVALLGGDLMRSVGGTGALREECVTAPIDVVRVDAAGETAGAALRTSAGASGGETAWFVANLVARRSWWRGELVVAMNAQFRGVWDVAPRSHPNDGRVDLVRVAAEMSLRHRLQARSRLPQGTHLPHPAIETRQVKRVELQFHRPLRLWLDGAPWLTASGATLTVEPDALQIVF